MALKITNQEKISKLRRKTKALFFGRLEKSYKKLLGCAEMQITMGRVVYLQKRKDSGNCEFVV